MRGASYFVFLVVVYYVFITYSCLYMHIYIFYVFALLRVNLFFFVELVMPIKTINQPINSFYTLLRSGFHMSIDSPIFT